VYAFDDCCLDPARVELRRDGEPVHVEPQVFDVLAFLLVHRDRVVTKTELLDEVWGNRFVSDSTLTSRVKAARRAIGDDGARQRLIATVHGVGYRFVGDVTEPAVDPVVGASAPPEERAAEGRSQEIRYGRSEDGVEIAYATSGPGLLWSRRRTG
jgi:DNA-binding winged helix-turn-helix (wHTH) protein